MRNWVFLSPHFDDVVLSAGGMVKDLTTRGDTVEIWTICAGDPPPGKPLSDYARMLHLFFELGDDDVLYSRSLEDVAACRLLAASYRRYTLPDCIYRFHPDTGEPFIKLPDDIKKDPLPDEADLIPAVTDFLRKNLTPGSELVTPLTIGHHRDHVLVRKAAEGLGMPLWHYVDYPYIVQEKDDLAAWLPAGAEQFAVSVSADGLKAWQDGVACHRSQIIFFWADESEMRTAIEQYSSSGGGTTLWKF